MFQVTDGIKKKKKSTLFPRASQFQSFNSCCAIVWDYYSFFLLILFFSFFESFFFYINVNMDVVVLKESVLMAVLLYDLGMERLLISPLVVVVVVVVVVMDGCGKVCLRKKKKKKKFLLPLLLIIIIIIINLSIYHPQLFFLHNHFSITFIIYQPHSLFYHFYL